MDLLTSYSGTKKKVPSKSPPELNGGGFRRSRRKTLARLRRAEARRLAKWEAAGIMSKVKEPVTRLGFFYWGDFTFALESPTTRGQFKRKAWKAWKKWAAKNRPELALNIERAVLKVRVTGDDWEITVDFKPIDFRQRCPIGCHPTTGGRAETELGKAFDFTA